MGEASNILGNTASLTGFFSVVIVLTFALAEHYGVRHLRIRSIIGLIGLIICTFIQKWAFLTSYFAADRRPDGTPTWVGSPEPLFFAIGTCALIFHSMFAFEAAMKQRLPYGKHPVFVNIICLLTAISALTEAWLLNFEKARGFSPTMNISLGACFLDLYIILKTDF